MPNYDWDRVVEQRMNIKQKAEESNAYDLVGRQLNIYQLALMRLAAHISVSPGLSSINTISDSYYLGIHLFCTQVIAQSENVKVVEDALPYIISKIGDSSNNFNEEYVDSIARNLSKSVFPFISGLISEYTNMELVVSTDFHVIKLSKFIIMGVINGMAIREVVKNDDGTAKSWFHDYQNYVSEVYQELSDAEDSSPY